MARMDRMDRMDEIEATSWLHTAILGAMCNHLQRDPSFALKLSQQLTLVEARLEAGDTSEELLSIFVDLRTGLGL